MCLAQKLIPVSCIVNEKSGSGDNECRLPFHGEEDNQAVTIRKYKVKRGKFRMREPKGHLGKKKY